MGQSARDVARSSQLVLPNDVEEAISALAGLGENGIPVAGATWVMRAPIRRERSDRCFVSLARIAELREIAIDENQLSLGCLVTHDELAEALGGIGDLQGLAQAAANSANPAIRRAATIGGNICTADFAAADLLPALLALDASVETQDQAGTSMAPLQEFVATRHKRPPSALVTRIIVPRSDRRSVHTRLTLRKAGDYPVANFSASIGLDRNGRIENARIAVGAVEKTARRWTGFESTVVGKDPDPAEMKLLSTSCAAEFSGRDGTDAPGWYRLRVLPSLVGRAFENLKSQCSRRGRWP